MNAAEKLAREIARVAVVREHYQEVATSFGRAHGLTVNCHPAIALMDAALEQAFLAAGTNDAITVLSALKELEGFEE